MSTASLGVKRLARLLKQLRVDCQLIEDDRSADHCVLRLTGARLTEKVISLEYINQGGEPRAVILKVVGPRAADAGDQTSGEEEVLELRGPLGEDAAKIVRFFEERFLKSRV